MLRWLTHRILQAFRTCKDNFNTCLVCDRLSVILVCFTYFNTLYLSVWSETGHCGYFFYCVFVIVRLMITSLSPLITLCCGTFYLDVYLVDDVSFRLCLQQVYSVGGRLLCYTRLTTCMCLMFHLYLVSHLLGARPTNVTLVNA